MSHHFCDIFSLIFLHGDKVLMIMILSFSTFWKMTVNLSITFKLVSATHLLCINYIFFFSNSCPASQAFLFLHCKDVTCLCVLSDRRTIGECVVLCHSNRAIRYWILMELQVAASVTYVFVCNSRMICRYKGRGGEIRINELQWRALWRLIAPCTKRLLY